MMRAAAVRRRRPPRGGRRGGSPVPCSRRDRSTIRADLGTDVALGLMDVSLAVLEPGQGSLTVLERGRPGLTPASGLLWEAAAGGVGTLFG